MDILQQIMAERAESVAASKRAVSMSEIEARAAARSHVSLRAALSDASGTRIIAETKKASWAEIAIGELKGTPGGRCCRQDQWVCR